MDATSEFVDGWIVGKQLGKGGFGTVYDATNTDTGQRAALKRFKGTDRSKAAEVRALETVGAHSNIVGLFDHGDNWIALELLDGQDLGEVIHGTKPLFVADALDIIHDVAEALDHCHARGIVHGDVKPHNVMVQPDRAVLIDFGISSPTGIDRDSMVGTPGYVAPEVLDNDSDELLTDARADVYALGALLHAALAGDSPFVGDTPVGTLRNQLAGEPKIGDNVGEHYAEVIRIACALEPHERYATAHEFSVSLNAAEYFTNANDRS